MLRGKGTLAGHLWGMKNKNCCNSNEKIFAAFSETTSGLYMPNSPLGTADAVTSVRAFGQSREIECHLGAIQRIIWAFYRHWNQWKSDTKMLLWFKAYLLIYETYCMCKCKGKNPTNYTINISGKLSDFLIWDLWLYFFSWKSWCMREFSPLSPLFRLEGAVFRTLPIRSLWDAWIPKIPLQLLKERCSGEPCFVINAWAVHQANMRSA